MEAEIGNKVRIILKNNFHYTGIIIEVDEKNIVMIDLFNKTISLAKDSIMLLEVSK